MVLTLAIAATLLAAGCKKDDKKIDAAAKPTPVPKPDAAPPPPAPDAAPAVKTEVVKVEGIGMENKDFEFDAPPGAKVELDPGGDEQFPRGSIIVGEVEILIQDPEAGHSSLADEQGMIARGDGSTTFLRAEADPDGYTIVYSQDKAGVKQWSVTIDRPTLDVSCGAWELKSSADADTVAAVCRSIRLAK